MNVPDVGRGDRRKARVGVGLMWEVVRRGSDSRPRDQMDFSFADCWRVTHSEPPLTDRYVESASIVTGGLQLLAQGPAHGKSPTDARYCECIRTRNFFYFSHCSAISSLHSPGSLGRGLPFITKTFCLQWRDKDILWLWPFWMVKEEILRALGGEGFPQDLTEEAFHRRHKPWLYSTSELCGCEKLYCPSLCFPVLAGDDNTQITLLRRGCWGSYEIIWKAPKANAP